MIGGWWGMQVGGWGCVPATQPTNGVVILNPAVLFRRVQDLPHYGCFSLMKFMPWQFLCQEVFFGWVFYKMFREHEQGGPSSLRWKKTVGIVRMTMYC